MIRIKMKNIYCDRADLQDILLFFDTIKNYIIVKKTKLSSFETMV